MKLGRLVGACAALALGLMGNIAPATERAVEVSPLSQHGYESASSGYFRDQDTVPGAFQIYIQRPEMLGALWGAGPRVKKVGRASFYTDAHQDEPDYQWRRCIDCHENYGESLHSTRAQVTCIQCHRGKPVAGIFHYYSPMNPMRRHAYVCAKCHEGATANFATYVVHEPPVLDPASAEEFPLLFYGFWFMAILAGGVFVVFIPYTVLWGFRELVAVLSKKVKSREHPAV